MAADTIHVLISASKVHAYGNRDRAYAVWLRARAMGFTSVEMVNGIDIKRGARRVHREEAAAARALWSVEREALP